MQKGYAPIPIILGLLTIAVILGGAYYLGTLKNSKPQNPVITSNIFKPPPNSSSDGSMNWRTFSSLQLPYSFKYPDYPKWNLSTLDESNRVYLSCETCLKNDNIFSVEFNDAPDKSLNEYIKATRPTAYKEIKLFGNDAIEALIDPSSTVGYRTSGYGPQYLEYFILHKGKGYIITIVFQSIGPFKKVEDIPKLNPDILSTFKFTN